MLKIALDKWYHSSVIKPNSLKTLVFQQHKGNFGEFKKTAMVYLTGFETTKFYMCISTSEGDFGAISAMTYNCSQKIINIQELTIALPFRKQYLSCCNSKHVGNFEIEILRKYLLSSNIWLHILLTFGIKSK